MKVSTRDVLAELLVEALDDSVTAAAVRCLAAYGRACESEPHTRVVDELLPSAQPIDRERTRQRLRECALLSWDQQSSSGQVSLASGFVPEWPELRSQLIQYGAALGEWTEVRGESDLTHALRKGVLLFNHNLFFEVHEVLEPEWMKEHGDVKSFLQGLIQVAVAFYHLGRRNLEGARSLLHEGLLKIIPHSPAFLGIELRDFIAGLEVCRHMLARLSLDTLDQVQTDRIPRMQRVG